MPRQAQNKLGREEGEARMVMPAPGPLAGRPPSSLSATLPRRALLASNPCARQDSRGSGAAGAAVARPHGTGWTQSRGTSGRALRRDGGPGWEVKPEPPSLLWAPAPSCFLGLPAPLLNFPSLQLVDTAVLRDRGAGQEGQEGVGGARGKIWNSVPGPDPAGPECPHQYRSPGPHQHPQP